MVWLASGYCRVPTDTRLPSIRASKKIQAGLVRDEQQRIYSMSPTRDIVVDLNVSDDALTVKCMTFGGSATFG